MFVFFNVLIIAGVLGLIGLWIFNNFRRWDFFKNYEWRKRK